MVSARLLLLAGIVAAGAGWWVAAAGTQVQAQTPYARPQAAPPTVAPAPRPQPRTAAPASQPRQPQTTIIPQVPLVVPKPLEGSQRLRPQAQEQAPAAQPQRTRQRRTQPVAAPRSTGQRQPPQASRTPRANLADAPLPRPRPGLIGTDAPLPVARPQPFAFEPPLREPDVVVVAFAGGTPETMAEAVAADLGLSVLSQASIGLVDLEIFRLHIPDGRAVETVLAALEADGRAMLGVPNHVFAVQDAPAGPGALQYAATRLALDEAHGLASGRDVPVAVIDTGVDLDHEALREATIRTATVFDAEAQAPGPHGTEMAGAMVAQGMLRGVSPAIDLIVIEAFRSPREGAQAEATTFGIAQALDRAHDAEVRIINMSFAGGRDALLNLMLDALDERGVVLVAAAGNGGPEAPPAFPGAHDKTIAVTAIDASDALYRGANRGDYVTIAAPGVDVIAVTVDGRYRLVTGTSIAAAHVAGIAALLLEGRPELAPEEIRALLADFAVDLGPPGPDPKFGAGLVQPVPSLIGAAERVASPVEFGAAN